MENLVAVLQVLYFEQAIDDSTNWFFLFNYYVWENLYFFIEIT